jgi:hypothetical protein
MKLKKKIWSNRKTKKEIDRIRQENRITPRHLKEIEKPKILDFRNFFDE